MKHLLTLLLLSLLAACSGPRHLADESTWTLRDFQKLDANNPVLQPDSRSKFRCPVRRDPVRWEEKDVFNPAAVVRDGRVWLLYRAEDVVGRHAGTSRIGLAESTNGLWFNRRAEPVLYPDRDDMKEYEWEGGCEDPRVVRRDDGLYVMTYTAYDGSTARLCIASSSDLVTWKKHGLAFSQKKYRNLWSKSGAIVCERTKTGDITARKVKGKYRMYWGDTDMFMATSEDLLEWKPLEDRNNQLVRAMTPRAGYFDSRLVEPGPFALLRRDGILMLYNSANSPSSGDKSLAADTYSVGQALFSKTKPEQLLARASRYALTPDRPYELTGQVNNVCFLEGMVWWDKRWLLYYGTADSKIAAATCRD